MASMNEKDYYALLGVEQTATTEEIRKAFQQKARKLHPDVNKEPDAEERFKEVSEAYAVLSDDDKRRRYDAIRSGNPFAGQGFGDTSRQGDPYAGASPFGWGFPFGAASRTAPTRSRAFRPKAGADITFDLTIDEELAAQGGSRGITYQRYATCEACEGRGSTEHTHAETCPTCGGSGRITVDLASLLGFGVMEMTCPECEGAGQVVASPCSACGGSGRILTAAELVVDIPAGSHDGDVVRISGMGNAGTNGELAGDFVCRIGVPSEQLSAGQARGFYLIGLALPFLVVGFIMQTLASMLVLIVMLCGIGIALIVNGGGLRFNKRWWRNASLAIGSGASNGLMLALFFSLMMSCSAARYRSWGY